MPTLVFPDPNKKGQKQKHVPQVGSVPVVEGRAKHSEFVRREDGTLHQWQYQIQAGKPVLVLVLIRPQSPRGQHRYGEHNSGKDKGRKAPRAPIRE